jgi:hypothetical protein
LFPSTINLPLSEIAPTVGLLPVTPPKKTFIIDGRSLGTYDLMMIAQGWYRVQVR